MEAPPHKEPKALAVPLEEKKHRRGGRRYYVASFCGFCLSLSLSLPF
jgi:hypothetical protein